MSAERSDARGTACILTKMTPARWPHLNWSVWGCWDCKNAWPPHGKVTWLSIQFQCKVHQTFSRLCCKEVCCLRVLLQYIASYPLYKTVSPVSLFSGIILEQPWAALPNLPSVNATRCPLGHQLSASARNSQVVEAIPHCHSQVAEAIPHHHSQVVEAIPHCHSQVAEAIPHCHSQVVEAIPHCLYTF